MHSKQFILAILLTFIHHLLPAQDKDTRYIRFRDEDPVQRIRHYRITSIKDDRTDTTTIGELKLGVFGKKSVSINFEQGVTTAVSRLVQRSFSQDTAATPFEMHITELNIKEVPSGLRTKIEAVVTLTFYINGTRLTDYKGRGEVQTMGDVLKHTEDLIRQSIRNSLLEFDNWWGKNKSLHAPDAPVTLIVEIDHTPRDTNRIGYSPARPLIINDFIAKPDELSLAAAQTASAIGIKYAANVDNGQFKVHVLVSPYFDKTRSWFAEKYRKNARVLVHEQRHFDITALKACELADTLRQQKFTKDNYLEKLEQIHAQKLNELNVLQNQYDTETRHGTNIAIQDKWNKLLKDMLAAQSCYQ